MSDCNDGGNGPCGDFDFGNDCAFTLDASELKLFDCIATELNNAGGTPIEFFHLEVCEGTRDPLYDEPIQRVFRGPYIFKAHVTQPESQPQATEQGFKNEWTGEIWMARADLEKVGAPAPFEGDVVRIWGDQPYFDEDAVSFESIPNKGFYFDVTKVDPDGHLFTTSSFVGFKLITKRRTEFTPERRILPP